MTTQRVPAFAALVTVGCALAAPAAQAQELAPLPPPPVYTQPAYGQPGYGQPVYAQPGYAPYPTYAWPGYVRPRPLFRPQFGVGLRALGAWHDNGLVAFGQGGVAVDLLGRVSPHLVTELSGGYHRVGYHDRALYDRTDVPVSLGLRVHVLGPRAVVSPYLAVGLGATWARLQLPEVPEFLEQAWFLEGHLGGGLEIRIGRYFALNADLRGVGKVRVDQGPRFTSVDATGQERWFMGHQLGMTVNAGAAVYF